MTLEVEENGKTFTFPDGTPPEEIDQTINEYFGGAAETTLGGVAMSAVTGINDGLMALADLPSDVINLLYRQGGNLLGLDTGDGKIAASVSDVVNLIPTGQGGLADVATRSPADTSAEKAVNMGASVASGGIGFAGGAKRLATHLDDAARLAKGTSITNPSIMSNIAKNKNFMNAEANASLGAGGGAAAASYLFPDSPYAPMVGTLAGGLSAAPPKRIAQTAKATKAQIVDPWTDAGIKDRIGKVLREHSSDPQAAIDNINDNQKLFRELLGEDAEIPSTILANDPGLSDTFFKLATDDPKILQILNSFKGEADDMLLGAIRELKGQGKADDTVAAINSLYARINRNMDARLSAVSKKADEIVADIDTGDVPEELSSQFSEALESMHGKFQATESKLWTSIPEAKGIDFAPFKAKFKQYASGQTPERWSQMDPEVKALVKNLGGKGGKGDMRSLLDMRSILLEKGRSARASGQNNLSSMLRDVDELIGGFIDSPAQEVGEAYRRAAALTRRKHEAFTQGSIGKIRGYAKAGDVARSPETRLRALARSQEAGSTSGKDIHRAAAGDEVEGILPDSSILKTTEDYLGNRFAHLKTPSQRDTFIRNHSPILRQFPSLKQTLEDVAGEAKTLADDFARTKGRKATLNDRNQFYAAKLLDSDPLKLTDTLLSMTDGDLSSLKTILKGDPMALEGMQSAVLDSLQGRLISSRGEVGGSFLDAMYKKDPRLERVIKTVLTQKQRDGLALFNKALRSLEPPAVSGAKPNTTDALKTSGLVRLISRVTGARAGAKAAEGSSSILAANAAANFSEAIANGYTKGRAQDVLNLSLRDPKVMKELLRPMRGDLGMIAADDKLRGYLITLGYPED